MMDTTQTRCVGFAVLWFHKLKIPASSVIIACFAEPVRAWRIGQCRFLKFSRCIAVLPA